MIVVMRRGLWRACSTIVVVTCIAASTPAALQTNQPTTLSTDPRALLSEGRALLKQRNTADADRVLQAAIDAANRSNLDPNDDDRVIGDASIILGGLRRQAGQNAAAVAYFRQALTVFERLHEDGGIARALTGIVSSAQLPFAEEESLLQRSLRHARAAGLPEIEADALHSWGDGLFTDGQYERALSKLLEAETVATAANDIDELGTIYNSMGRLYRNHGQLETALDLQLKALRLHEQLPGSFVLMQSLNAVGVTYQALGDHANARRFLHRALDSAIATSSTRMQDFVRANLVSSLAEQGAYEESAGVLEGVIERGLDNYPQQRHAQLSEVYRLMGRLSAALAASDKAIEICGSRDDAMCFTALDERAQTHLALGNRAAALADLTAAANMIERIRGRLMPADFARQNFGAALQSWYGRTIQMQLTGGQIREALDTSERGRSRAFVDLLASRDVVLQEGARAARAATIDDLDRVATRLGSTLLMYWVTPTQLYIWTVAPGGNVQSATVAVRESKLAALVQATAPFAGRSARGSSIAGDATTWRQLYDLLIKPVRASLPRTPGALITIVPHGPLSMLSFAALQDQQRRYLLEDFMLHYVPAGAVLDFTAGRRRNDARSGDMLVVADPSYRRKSSLDAPLPALPGSRAEARSIVGLSSRDRVTVLEGDAASEARVRATTAGKSVLHFATHAIVNDAAPFSSFLALGGSASADDGTLTAQEIYGLKLQADVVVLSACRSGGGRVTGDGMATFARAFMYAGTPSLITSVWDVADESSAQLIPGFYREWRAGASKARALRNTQLAFLRNLRAGTVRVNSLAGLVVLPEHPALWAGFMLIGEPD